MPKPKPLMDRAADKVKELFNPVSEWGAGLGKIYANKKKSKSMREQMQEMMDPKTSEFARIVSEKFKKKK